MKDVLGNHLKDQLSHLVHVDSTNNNRIGTDCTSSWKGTPTHPSDDACSRNKVQRDSIQRLRAKTP